MKSLYELLDAHPDDDAEGLKHAFRRAVKASHPDTHPHDVDASTRLRQVIEAYAILRDPEQRTAYDWLLEFDREQVCSPATVVTGIEPSNSYTIHKFAFHATVVACFAAVMAGAALLAHLSKTYVEAVQVVEAPAREPASIAAVQLPARTDPAHRDERRDKVAVVEVPNVATAPGAVAPAANGGQTPVADGEPPLTSAKSDTEVAKIPDAPLDRADTKTAAQDIEKNSGIEPLDPKPARSARLQVSSLNNSAPKLAASHFAIKGEKRDVKTQAPKRPGIVAKGQAANHTSFQQVSLESRSSPACFESGSCSGQVPLVFGVGF
jgi:hypothetical protein